MLRKVFAIAWKDILLRFSSPAEWLFFLILPIVFTLVLAGGTGGAADARVRLVVADRAGLAAFRTTDRRPRRVRLGASGCAAARRRGRSVLRRDTPALLVIPPEFDLAHLAAGQVGLELRQLPNDLDALVAGPRGAGRRDPPCRRGGRGQTQHHGGRTPQAVCIGRRAPGLF